MKLKPSHVMNDWGLVKVAIVEDGTECKGKRKNQNKNRNQTETCHIFPVGPGVGVGGGCDNVHQLLC